jgi:hypothetical protein
MVGTRLTRSGHTWYFTFHFHRLRVVLCGVTFNDVTKDVVFCTTTSLFVDWLGSFSQECQQLWFVKDDLQDTAGHQNQVIRILMTFSKYDYKYPPRISLTREFVLVTVNRTMHNSRSDVQQQETDPQWKHNRCLGSEVSDVVTSSYLVTSQIRWVRCLWC